MLAGRRVNNAPEWTDLCEASGITCGQIRRLGEGYDAVVWRVNREHVVKLAKHDDAFALLQAEAAALRLLAGELPVRLAAPIVEVAPSDLWEHGYSVQSYVPGKPLTAIGHGNLAHARQIGEFLRLLHTITPSPEPRSALTLRDRRAEAHIYLSRAVASVSEHLGRPVADTVSREAHRVINDDVDVDTRLIHNDLHNDHILMSGQNMAIIDWGDVGLGDPDADFLMLSLMTEPAFFRTCVAAYGHPDPERLAAKLDDLALLFWLVLIAYAPDLGSADDIAYGLDGLGDWMARRT